MTDEQPRPNRKFRLIMGTLAVAVVVSGGAAYAASQDDSPQARSQAIVTDAAGTLGVDPAKLSDALKKALENQVDAQVTAGTLTKAQGDAIKARIEDGTQPIFGGGGPRFGGFGGGPFERRGPGGMGKRGFGFGGPRGGFGLAAGLDDLSTFLGLTPAELRTQIESGKSLADIAKAQGKTVADLEAAITTAATKRLDDAVTAGKLTKDQETTILAGLAKHLDDFVNGVQKARGFGFGGPRGGFGLAAGLDDLSTFLGLTPAELRTQIESGKSLADIAKAQGKTVADLEAAITTAATKRLDDAVTAGKLTKDQETTILAGLAKHLDDFVNGVQKARGFGFGDRGGWGDHDKSGNGSAPTPPAPPAAAPADWAPAPEAA